jgi:hypothetical protein
VHSFASLKQEQLRLMHLARVQVQESWIYFSVDASSYSLESSPSGK